MSSLKLIAAICHPEYIYFGGDKLTFKCHYNVVCISATSHRISTELIDVFPYRGQVQVFSVPVTKPNLLAEAEHNPGLGHVCLLTCDSVMKTFKEAVFICPIQNDLKRRNPHYINFS